MYFEKETYNLPPVPSNSGYAYHASLPLHPSFLNAETLPKATPIQRLLAFGIDLTIFLVFWFSGTEFYNHFNNELLQVPDLRTVWKEMLLLPLACSLFIFGGYAIYYTFTFGRGQTLGCQVAGLRFIRQSGQHPGFSRGLLRYICQILLFGFIFFTGYVGFIEPFFIRLLNGEKYYGLLDKPPIIIGVLLAWLVWALPHLTVLFNRKSQSLYDTMFQIFAVKTR